MDLDKLFPEKWRLPQRFEDGEFMPRHFPVFFKPEWGENAAGVFYANDPTEFAMIRADVANRETDYLIQQGAEEQPEFEIFSLQTPLDRHTSAVFSVTEVKNCSQKIPVNGIYNPATSYHDITDTLSIQQRQKIWLLLGQIGRFPISRLSIRANSIVDIVKGQFHIIELNLFTPMPIHLLDEKYSDKDRWKMIRNYMLILAKVTRHRSRNIVEKPVYSSLMLYNRKHPLAKLIRKLV